MKECTCDNNWLGKFWSEGDNDVNDVGQDESFSEVRRLKIDMGYLLIEYWFRWVIRLNVLMGLSLDFRGFAGKGVIGKSEESLASKSKLRLSCLLLKSALWLVGCHAMMNVVIALFGLRNAESSFWPILSLRPSMFGSKSWAWSSTRDSPVASGADQSEIWELDFQGSRSKSYGHPPFFFLSSPIHSLTSSSHNDFIILFT